MPTHTKHSNERCKKRGIRPHQQDLMFEYADIIQDAGGGCERWQLSYLAMDSMIEDGVPVDIVEKMDGMTFVICPETDELLTCYRASGHKSGKKSRQFLKRNYN